VELPEVEEAKVTVRGEEAPRAEEVDRRERPETLLPRRPSRRVMFPDNNPVEVEVEETQGLGEAVPVPELVELSVRTVEDGAMRVRRPEVVERMVDGEASP
jgi:hypothetical protein